MKADLNEEELRGLRGSRRFYDRDHEVREAVRPVVELVAALELAHPELPDTHVVSIPLSLLRRLRRAVEGEE